MRKDRIRARMKAAGKSIRDIIRERNEARFMYASLLKKVAMDIDGKTAFRIHQIIREASENYLKEEGASL